MEEKIKIRKPNTSQRLGIKKKLENIKEEFVAIKSKFSSNKKL